MKNDKKLTKLRERLHYAFRYVPELDDELRHEKYDKAEAYQKILIAQIDNAENTKDERRRYLGTQIRDARRNLKEVNQPFAIRKELARRKRILDRFNAPRNRAIAKWNKMNAEKTKN